MRLYPLSQATKLAVSFIAYGQRLIIKSPRMGIHFETSGAKQGVIPYQNIFLFLVMLVTTNMSRI
jgi:hypothetical protein